MSSAEITGLPSPDPNSIMVGGQSGLGGDEGTRRREVSTASATSRFAKFVTYAHCEEGVRYKVPYTG